MPIDLNARMMRSSHLFMSPLQGEYWLAMNPVAANGQPVVLNSAATQLLNEFRTTQTVKAVLSDASQGGLASELALGSLSEFCRLGLLVTNEWKPTPLSTSADTLVAWLHITNACNLRCEYCYLNKTSEDMTQDTGRRAVDAICRSAIAHGFKAIKLKFAGGEPTLKLDRVIALYDYASETCSRAGLILDAVILSNGTVHMASMVQAILERKIRLMISLDGLSEFHDRQRAFANHQGSFALVSKNIDWLLATGLAPEVSVTITGYNIDGLAQLVEYLLDRGLTFSFNFARGHVSSADQGEILRSDDRMICGLEAAYRVIERRLPARSLLATVVDRANFSRPHSRTCGVGDNYVAIDERGRVAKCQMAIANTVGSVDDTDIVSLIRRDMAGIQNLTVLEKEGCRNCLWRSWCTGGCALHTYLVTGRYDVKSPYCSVYQAIYPNALRLEGLGFCTKFKAQKRSNAENGTPASMALADWRS